MTDREKHIKNLSYIMDSIPDDACGEWRDSLAYAISSLKTDLKYDLMYEGEDVYTKDDMVAMLKELKYDLYPELCKKIHGKEDCPCVGQTISCLATFRVCDANRAIDRTIQQKINALKENKDATN